MNRLLIAVFGAAFVAARGFSPTPDVEARVSLSAKSAKAGSTITATITAKIPANHHAYAPPMGKDGSPVVNVALPKGSKLKIVNVSYPPGEYKKYQSFGDMVLHVYEGTIKIPVKIAIPKNIKGQTKIGLTLFYQICDNAGSCYPPKTVALTADIKVG